MEWSKEIASTEDISMDRYRRWVELWVPYKELNNEMKEQDRQLGQNALMFGEFMYGTDEEGAFDDVEYAMLVLSRLKERLTCTNGCVNVDGLV